MTYMLPGMGADATMYGSAFRQLSDVSYIDWPEYEGETTIAQVARKIIEQHHIGRDDIVGGSSLGGIVAAEISTQVDVRKLILIGSTLSPGSINPILKQLSVLSEITPFDLIKTFADKAGSLLESQMLTMFGHADSEFIRAMCKAVFEWQGNPEPACEVAHIHGAKDHVIYPPRGRVNLLVDAGHLIAITHEAEVAAFVKLSLGR